MRIMAFIDSGVVIDKAYENAIPDKTGWTDISPWPFVSEGENLNDAILNRARSEACSRIETSYTRAMLSGFTSSALGALYWYASDGLAMSLLIGSVAAGTSREFECMDRNEVKAMILHTAAQMIQVLNDGAAIAVSYKQKKRSQYEQIANALTVDEVNSIVW